MQFCIEPYDVLTKDARNFHVFHSLLSLGQDLLNYGAHHFVSRLNDTPPRIDIFIRIGILQYGSESVDLPRSIARPLTYSSNSSFHKYCFLTAGLGFLIAPEH